MMVRIGVIGLFAGLLCAGCANQSVTPAAEAPEALPAASSTSTGAHAGLRVYKDPQTGQFTDPPPADTATTTSVDQALNRSHEGLVAVPSEVPGGGVRLDLQGRFRSHFIATKDADGKVSIRCLPEDELPKP